MLDYISYILLFIFGIIIFILSSKIKKIESNEVDKYTRKTQKLLEEIEREKNKREKEKEDLVRELEEKKQAANELSEQIQHRIDAQNELIAEKVKLFEKEEHRRRAAEYLNEEINRRGELQQRTADLEYWYDSQIDELEQEYEKLKAEVSEFQDKQNAINEEIHRRRALEEKQDFYRIILDSDSIEDINVLNSIREKLHKRENLDKMLYDSYISKPVLEMTRRVLSNTAPSGIYKITNTITNEIYIGKSTDISKRWVGHIKSACGLDGVADSVFQRALKKYGIQNFTFELLEKVPKDKLTEREKFYITFYDTINYGYNQRLG